MRSCEVDIELEYRTTGVAWIEVALSPDQLFWPDPDDPNEVWGLGSPWLHEQPLHHVPPQQEAVRYVRLTLREHATGASHEFTYHHWAGHHGHARLSVWRAPNKATSRELIYFASVPIFENGSQVLRVDLDSDVPSVSMSVIMHGRGGDEFSEDLLSGA